jgi:nucleoside-triphosphatase THEP1
MHLPRRLLTGGGLTKVFLSGHVGSGKSTQINKLAASKRITDVFEVVVMRLESEEWDTIDGAQLQFRIAYALYD